MQERKRQLEAEQEALAEQEMKRLRAGLVHHAQPVKVLRLMQVQKSDRPLTEPLSTCLGLEKHKAASALLTEGSETTSAGAKSARFIMRV